MPFRFPFFPSYTLLDESNYSNSILISPTKIVRINPVEPEASRRSSSVLKSSRNVLITTRLVLYKLPSAGSRKVEYERNIVIGTWLFIQEIKFYWMR